MKKLKSELKFLLKILKNALMTKKTLKKFLIIEIRKNFHPFFCPAIRSNLKVKNNEENFLK